MLNITILSSTRGTYLPALHQNLLAAGFTINEVISNNPEAGIIAKAHQLGIPTFCIPSASPNFEATLTKRLEQTSTDLLVLLGFMKILSKEFTERWQGRIINIHPSLLPKYAGLMDLAVHQAVLDNQEKITGCTVHFVTAQVDAGEPVVQLTCAIAPTDTAASLKILVQFLEVEALTIAIKQIAMTGKCP